MTNIENYILRKSNEYDEEYRQKDLWNIFEIQSSKSYQEFLTIYDFVELMSLKKIFSMWHYKLNDLFCFMNKKSTTNLNFNALQSRELLKIIYDIEQMQNALRESIYKFNITENYYKIIQYCKTFLKESYGSNIPSNFTKIIIEEINPIFKFENELIFNVKTKQVITVSRKYIVDTIEKAKTCIINKEFDNALTKSRTLIEEVLVYILEQNDIKLTNKEKGDIDKTYNKFKNLYSMQQNENYDKQINELLGGLEKIIHSIGTMRNINSDSHGVGSSRREIKEYHAILFVNSALVFVEFIYSVYENNKFQKIQEG